VDINAGDPVRGKLSAGFFRDTGQMLDWYKRRKALGEGGAPPTATPINNCVVWVRNNTGSDLRRGEVVELNGGLLNPQDPRYLPFSGAMPNLERVGWGITLQQIPSGSIDDCLLLGVCIAYVVITDESHQYAERVSGSNVLRSTSRGPAKILQKMPNTGSVPAERECVVQLMDEGGDSVELVEVHHPTPALDGEIVAANEDGYHQGRIRTPNGTATYTIGGDVWLQFADGYDGYPDDDGAILATQGENYFAKYTGSTWGDGENERPLYVAICDERSFIGVSGSPIAKGATGTVALLHSTTFLSAEIGKTGRALQDIPPNALLKITRRAGVWMIELLDKTLVHFELIDELKLTGTGSGHAKAKILTWNGSAWGAGEGAVEIEVYDWFPGMWNGLAGYRGLAEYRPTQYTDPGEEEDEEDDVLRPVYEIIWMERPAQLIRFTSTSAMSSGSMSATVDWFDWQGRSPGSSVTVYDPDGVFPDVHSGAKGRAYYNNKEKRYEVLISQRIVQYAEATLSAQCCGSSASISGFTPKSSGEFVGSPPSSPTTATNPCGMAAASGSIVTLRRVDNSMPAPAWEIVAVARVLVQPLVAIRIDGMNFQYRTADCYLERCTVDLNDWENWALGEPECQP
jgi:hypothetical protein